MKSYIAKSVNRSALVLLLTASASSTVFLPSVSNAATGPRPVLYPNKHLSLVGETKAQHDINACSEQAMVYVQQGQRQGDGLRAGVRGAARGALLGTVGGAIAGNTGRGAAAGAVVGTTASAMKGVKERGARDPAYQKFVSTCLEDKGYRVLEWK